MTDLPIQQRVLDRALEIWREREMQLPERVRRMRPDQINHASGAWLACIIQAAKNITDGQQGRPDGSDAEETK